MMRKYDPKWFYNLRLRLVVLLLKYFDLFVTIARSASYYEYYFYFLNIWNFRVDLDKLDCCSGRRKACCCYILRLCWLLLVVRLQLVCALLPLT